MTSATPRTPSMSLLAAGVAISVAFVAGLVASLAIRPRTKVVDTTGKEVSIGPAPGSSAITDRLQWRVPTAFKSNLPGLGDNILYVTKTLKDTSGGAIAWQAFEPGKLLPPFGITDGVKDKKVQAGYTWLGYDQGKIPSSPLFSAVPFGMEPWEFAAWWYEDEGKKLAEDVYAPHGVHPILCGLIGPETAGWFREELKSIDDIDGLKIRMAGLGGKVLQKLGASVTVIPGGEIFGALEKGAIDGTEFSMPVIDQKLGFDRVAKNNYFPGWHQPYTAFHIIVNQELWAGLSPPTRALINTTCTAGVLRNLVRGEALQGDIVVAFKNRGVSARTLPAPMLQKLAETTLSVLTEEADNDPLFKKVYESQMKFSASYQHWKRLAYLPRTFELGARDE